MLVLVYLNGNYGLAFVADFIIRYYLYLRVPKTDKRCRFWLEGENIRLLA